MEAVVDDFFFMKELKKPVLRSRVKVASNGSSSRPPEDLSLCFRGRAGELLERPSPTNREAEKPKHKKTQLGLEKKKKESCESTYTL